MILVSTRFLATVAVALSALALHAELQIPDAGAAEAPNAAIAIPKPADSPAETPRNPFGEVLIFKNGDRLHGRLVGLDDQRVLTWQHRDVTAPLAFSTENLFAMRLDIGPEQEWLKKHTRVQLTNGDMLLGTIDELTGDKLVIDTPYGGRITVKRSMINSIQPVTEGQKKLIYEGPNDLSEWTISGGEWQLRGDSLSGFGRIGANVQLPDAARLRFEVQWPTRFTSFAVALYTPDLKNLYNDAYHMTFSGNSVTLHRRARDQGTLNLGQVEMPHLLGSRKARLELLINKETRSFALLFDDALIKEWTDPQGFAGKGGGIVFNSHDRTSPIVISNIVVSDWDGKLSSIGSPDVRENDVLQLANFDRVTGNVESIQQDEVAFRTPYATMNVPLGRISTLTFAHASSQRARRNQGDVELYFDDGEHVTLQLHKVDGEQVTGYSENIGTVTFDLDVFTAIRFNIYDDDLGPEAPDLEGNGEMTHGFMDLQW